MFTMSDITKTTGLHCALTHTAYHQGPIVGTLGPCGPPSPPPNAYSSHIKNSLISSSRARDQFGQLSKADRKTFVWSERERERRSPLKWLHRGGGKVERNYRTNAGKVGRGVLFNFVLIKGTVAHQRGGALVNTRLWGKRRGWMDQVGNCCPKWERNTPRVVHTTILISRVCDGGFWSSGPLKVLGLVPEETESDWLT